MKNKYILNAFFAVASIALIFFLLSAPEETTSPLPQDKAHFPFHKIKSKKEAEKGCMSCHSDNGSAPLADDHPSKYRCLFCHKR